MLAKRIQNIAASSTLKITARAKELLKDGLDVVNFAAGEPDFDTPSFIKEKAIQAIQQGFTKYTPSSGIPELKKVICEKFKRDNRLQYAPNQIIVSCGAKHSLFNLLQVLLDADEEVIIPAPFWVSYPEMIKLAGAKPIFVTTSPNDNFKLTPQELKKSITAKTKALIINSPSNPTGCVYAKEELQALSNICVASKIYVISDEIYEKLIYDNQEHISIGALNKEIYDLTITVNGLSKSFSMTGWRIGYLGASIDIANAIERLQDHSTSNPCSISQKAALAALESDGEWVNQMRAEFQSRRDYITGYLDKVNNLTYVKPQGAFYVFIDISKTKMDSLSFADRFLEEEKVAVIPGKGFGANNYIRISFATSMEQIKKGMDRLKDWVEKLSA